MGIEFVVHSLEGPILRRLANVNYNVSIVLPCFLMRHVSGAVTNHQALRMQATRDMHGKHYNTQNARHRRLTECEMPNTDDVHSLNKIRKHPPALTYRATLQCYYFHEASPCSATEPYIKLRTHLATPHQSTHSHPSRGPGLKL